MSQAGLDRLMAVGYIPKLQAKTDFCEHCRYGKQTRSPHSLHYETIRQPLELVHTDRCGLIPEKSLGGSRYFITFVDDCTRKVWAYSLRSKDEVLAVLSRWLAEVENRIGHRVKTLRSDNRGEYTSQAFKQYLSEKGLDTKRPFLTHPCRMEWQNGSTGQSKRG